MSLTSDSKHQADADTDIDRLLALAGPRDAVPAERLDRMRAAVHRAWTAETKPRAKRLFVWALGSVAAASAVVIAAMMLGQPWAREQAPADRRIVYVPEISTAPGELRSIRLRNGADIRIDGGSRVSITEDQRLLWVNAGAVYIDSRDAANMPEVRTPGGDITDIGTRFEIRVIDFAAGVTRVRVRDGRVRMKQNAVIVEAGAEEELMSDPRRGGIDRRHANPFGAEWAWVARAAPRFDVEGKSLTSFLDWIEQEGGWTVVFASPALERSARSTVLHGSVEDMSTTEALETILLASGLVHRVDLKTGRVTVASEGSREGGR